MSVARACGDGPGSAERQRLFIPGRSSSSRCTDGERDGRGGRSVRAAAGAGQYPRPGAGGRGDVRADRHDPVVGDQHFQPSRSNPVGRGRRDRERTRYRHSCAAAAMPGSRKAKCAGGCGEACSSRETGSARGRRRQPSPIDRVDEIIHRRHRHAHRHQHYAEQLAQAQRLAEQPVAGGARLIGT